MIKKIVTGVLLVGLIVGAWALYDYRQKWKSGYCFAENRMITDDELVDTGVTQLLKNLEREYQSLPREEQTKRIRYQGLKDFYERQPRCCGFSGDSGRSIYPRPPTRGLYKDGWIKPLRYQFRIDGEKRFRSANMLVPFCGGSASIHQDVGSIYVDGVLVQLPKGVGDDRDYGPNNSINKMNIRTHESYANQN